MGKTPPKKVQGAQERLPVADRYLVMGLAGKLRWTNEKIGRQCPWIGRDCVVRWGARGRAGYEDAEDHERAGRPRKLTPARARRLKGMCEVYDPITCT